MTRLRELTEQLRQVLPEEEYGGLVGVLHKIHKTRAAKKQQSQVHDTLMKMSQLANDQVSTAMRLGTPSAMKLAARSNTRVADAAARHGQKDLATAHTSIARVASSRNTIGALRQALRAAKNPKDLDKAVDAAPDRDRPEKPSPKTSPTPSAAKTPKQLPAPEKTADSYATPGSSADKQKAAAPKDAGQKDSGQIRPQPIHVIGKDDKEANKDTGKTNDKSGATTAKSSEKESGQIRPQPIHMVGKDEKPGGASSKGFEKEAPSEPTRSQPARPVGKGDTGEQDVPSKAPRPKTAAKSPSPVQKPPRPEPRKTAVKPPLPALRPKA